MSERKSSRLEFRVSPELLASIDEARGDVPRSRWLERAIEGALLSAALTPKASTGSRVDHLAQKASALNPQPPTTAAVDPVLKERKRRSDKPFRPMPKS
jgi:hypothetical protein